MIPKISGKSINKAPKQIVLQASNWGTTKHHQIGEKAVTSTFQKKPKFENLQFWMSCWNQKWVTSWNLMILGNLQVEYIQKLSYKLHARKYQIQSSSRISWLFQFCKMNVVIWKVLSRKSSRVNCDRLLSANRKIRAAA